MEYFTGKRFSLKQVVIMLTVAFSGIAVMSYAAVTIPNTFTSGSKISSSQVNENFSTLAAALPAMAYVYNYDNGDLPTTITSLVSMTITPPSDGYIMVSGSGNFTISQGTTADNFISARIKMTAGGSSSVSVTRRTGLNTVSGSRIPVTTNQIHLSQVFQVTGGVPATVNLEAWRDNSGANTVKYGVPNNHANSLVASFAPNKLQCTKGNYSWYGSCN